MSKEWSVYRHDCPDGRCYIGITCREPKYRWQGGLGYQDSNPDFFKYILANGWDNIEHKILHSGLTEEEARSLEKKEILAAGSRVFNILHANKVLRAVPLTHSEKLEDLTEVEKRALDIWVKALYDDDSSELKWALYQKGYITRTVEEFESGDENRINRELAFIESRRKQKEAI